MDLYNKGDKIFRVGDIGKFILETHDPLWFYHISPHPLHDDDYTVRMKPCKISSSEPELACVNRICVAPTIEQCLVAIAPQLSSDTFYIYRTMKRASKTCFPFGVRDSPITQERWFNTPRKFKLVGKIPMMWDSIRSVDGKYSMSLKFDCRGGEEDFSLQQNELYRVRNFASKYSKEWFLTNKLWKEHNLQRQQRLRLNRNDFTRLLPESFD